MAKTIEEQIKHYCAYQERSHKEVRTKLLNLDVYGDELEELMQLLIQENFLNEERYAIAYAGGKFRIKKWGKLKITQGLKIQNVSDYCIAKALKEVEEIEYQKTIQRLFENKLSELQGEKNTFKKKMKLKNYFLQKGYSYEDISGFLNRL